MATLHEARPRLHLTPPANWMNDPNGLFFVDGELHATYQHNPDAAEWGRMHWGHAASTDLITWRHLPVALSPDTDGVDDFGCWSGGVVEADGGAAHAFYTGVHLADDVRHQGVSRATSVDPERRTWTKDPGNPLIAGAPSGVATDLFRDPFVFRDGEGWRMLVGAGTHDGRGAVVEYRSDDLRAWRGGAPILSAAELDPASDGDGPMWECPQLLRFEDRDVLIVSIVDRSPGIRPSHVLAIVGRLEEWHFSVERARQLGMGPDLYAPACVRAPDGRWLLFGWIPEDPPGADTDRSWAGALTLPRHVTRSAEGVSLSFAAEVESSRRDRVRFPACELAADSEAVRPPPPSSPASPFEIDVAIEPDADATVAVELRDEDHADPLARVGYRAADRQLTIARRGIVAFAGRSSMSAVTIPDADGPTIRLRLIVDSSILEMEANGHVMATARLPASVSEGRSVAITATGGRARISSLDVWSLGDPLRNEVTR